jgi:hypothetical protein
MKPDMTERHDSGCRVDAAWLPGHSVAAAYDAISDLLPQDAHVLLTALDSDFELRNATRLHERLRSAGIESLPLGGGLVLTRAAVAELLNDTNYFTGFDELWVFPTFPATPKPSAVVLTSERQVEASEELVRWMGAGCLVGLGDGDGLNFATCEPRIAARLRGLVGPVSGN